MISLFWLTKGCYDLLGLLQVLFLHMQFPQGFTNWEGWVEDDEEAFNRFRRVAILDRAAYNACAVPSPAPAL